MDPVVTAAICDLAPAHWLLLGPNVPTLVYYTHLLNLAVSILFGIFVLFHNRKALSNKIFFFTILAFATWIFFALVFWANNAGDIIMFSWLMDILVEPLVHIGVFYLLYSLIAKKDLPFSLKLFFVLLYLPIPLFLPTTLTLSGFDVTTCLAIEGPIALYYTYLVEVIATSSLILFVALQYVKATTETKKEVLYLGIGSFLFLFAFSWGNIIGSFTEDWQLGQYGLMGMPLFLGFLLYTIVKFRTFKIRLLSTQALFASSWVLLGALLFIDDVNQARLVIVINLIFFGLLGYQVIRSVKNEIRQKEENEKLAQKLEKANERLKVLDKMKSEFVSIASHQLRSPLTSIRGYASMLLEGSYGKLPPKARDAVERISESSRFMATSVEDYLNVSRIQAGNMKYEYSDFNMKDLAQQVADDTRQLAMKKGLLLTFKSNLSKKGIVHADIGKTRQVIDNLINNALKYTPRGTISIFVYDDPKKKQIYVDVSDTGIGMSPQTIDDMFEKFERAHNANAVNVTGTGLGLYIARKIAQEMDGDVTAVSEGEGKGSTFTFYLPLQM